VSLPDLYNRAYMNIVIFYFSGTGNTKWVVNKFKELDTDNLTRIYSIEEKIDDLKMVIEENDMLGFAYPIYAASMPAIMKRFFIKVNGIIKDNDYSKDIFFMSTAGYADTFGPYAPVKIINSKNLNLKGYASIKILNNVSTPKSKFNPASKEKLIERLKMAEIKIKKIVDDLTANKKYIDLGLYLVSGVMRKTLRNALKDGYKSFSVDDNLCIKCMKCVDECPTKSIEYRDGKFKFLPKCTMCHRCYNFCPQYAILIDNIYASPDEYFRYRGPEEYLNR